MFLLIIYLLAILFGVIYWLATGQIGDFAADLLQAQFVITIGMGFKLAVIIILSTFLLGAGLNHMKELFQQKNFNYGNSLIILPDILIPITLISLWLFVGCF